MFLPAQNTIGNVKSPMILGLNFKILKNKPNMRNNYNMYAQQAISSRK